MLLYANTIWAQSWKGVEYEGSIGLAHSLLKRSWDQQGKLSIGAELPISHQLGGGSPSLEVLE